MTSSENAGRRMHYGRDAIAQGCPWWWDLVTTRDGRPEAKGRVGCHLTSGSKCYTERAIALLFAVAATVVAKKHHLKVLHACMQQPPQPKEGQPIKTPMFRFCQRGLPTHQNFFSILIHRVLALEGLFSLIWGFRETEDLYSSFHILSCKFSDSLIHPL